MDKYSFDRFVKQKNQNRAKKIVRLIVTFLILSFVSYLFIEAEVFKDNNTLFYIFMVVLASIAAYFNGYFKAPTEELEGIFEGKVTFAKDYIEINEEKYPLNTIQSITIHNNDYKGKKVLDHGEFEKKGGSQGVDNQVILDLGKRQFVEASFKQNSLNEFDKMKKILIAYHIDNKLSFDDLVYILKIEYDIDKNVLRKQISKVK